MSSEKSCRDLRLICLEIKEGFSSRSHETVKWDLLKEFYRYLKENDLSEIASSYYSVTTILIDSLRPTLFTEKWQEQLFDSIFLQGIHHEAFMILVRKLGDSGESFQQKKILNILQKFLEGPSLENLLLSQCLSSGNQDMQYISLSRIWNDLITLILSLPSRVENKTKGQMNKIFRMNYYVPLLATAMLKVFSILHTRIKNCKNCTLEFIGLLVGRLSITGNADIIAKKFCVEFIKCSETDFIWRKLSQNLISKMPISSLEPFITNLLLVVPWYGYVDWILGEETMKNEKLLHLMTVKLLFFRHFKQGTILQNIIGHFGSAESRQEQFWAILESLLKIWTNPSSLKHQSHEQQKYIAIALMICCGWLKLINNSARSKVYLDQVLKGTEIRIGSSDDSVRSFGMIVGSTLISALDPEAEKLDFQGVVDSSMLEEMQKFTKIQQTPEKNLESLEKDLKCFEEVELAKNKQKPSLREDKPKTTDSKIEIEEEDDLEPYDMSDDAIQTKRPLYLNDCLQGLIEQENAEWVEQCLKHAESLIISNSDTVHEIAEELTKVMLHLEDKYSTENFDILRKQILISLTIHSPVLVAGYLTSQFYEDNYNIQQRLDILEVISASSLKLSKPNSKLNEPERQQSKDKLSSDKEWRIIIEERIAAKSRYITKGPKKALPEPSENKFAPAAGYFFYPLMEKYDKQNKMLRLFGEDSYVLGRLVYTLGTVMYAASNAPLCLQMGKALMEFLLTVRNHEDVFVREAAIFALAAVYTSVPGYLLFTADQNTTSIVIESQQWLDSVINNDVDTNCQMKATYALGLILGIMKEETPLLTGILNS